MAENIIGKNCKIGENVTIGPNAFIGDGTVIGDDTVIQYGAYIENDCVIGSNSRIGTNAVLRRETHIGDNSIFGSLSASEGKCWIGNNVLIHTQCHITTGLIVEDYVFIAPGFIGANDPDMLHARRDVKCFVPQASHIKFGARIAIGVMINPGVTIGREAVIGSASVVTRDIDDFAIAFGMPAKARGEVCEDYRLSEDKYKSFCSRVSEEALLNIREHLISDYRI